MIHSSTTYQGTALNAQPTLRQLGLLVGLERGVRQPARDALDILARAEAGLSGAGPWHEGFCCGLRAALAQRGVI